MIVLAARLISFSGISKEGLREASERLEAKKAAFPSCSPADQVHDEPSISAWSHRRLQWKRRLKIRRGLQDWLHHRTILQSLALHLGGQTQRAIEMLEQCDRRVKNFPAFGVSILADYYLESDQPGLAALCWERLAKSYTSHVHMRALVRAFLRDGIKDKAKFYTKAYFECFPDHFDGFLELAHAFREAGYSRESIVLFRKILHCEKADPAKAVGKAAVLAAAAEYAGDSHAAEHWMAEWERQKKKWTADWERQSDLPSGRLKQPISLASVTGSFGDMASRSDALLKLQKLDLLEETESQIYCPPEQKFANAAQIQLIQKFIPVQFDPNAYLSLAETIPWYVWRDYTYFPLADGRVVHNTTACALAEVEWQKQQRDPLFAIPPEWRQEGWDYLRSLGLNEGDWFVALHVRDDGYYKEHHSGVNSSNRSSDINTFIPSIQWIIDQGGWVIRLGNASSSKVGISLPRFIDYAHSDCRSDRLDLFLLAECRYFLGTNSGPMCVAAAFGKVSGIANYVPIAIPPLSPKNLFIPKLMYSEKEQRYLTFAEMVSDPFRGANRTHLFAAVSEELGVRLVDNTPEELLDFTKDLHAFADRGGVMEFVETDSIRKSFANAGCYYIAQCGPSFVRAHPTEISASVDPSFAILWAMLADEDLGCSPDYLEVASSAFKQGLEQFGLEALKAAAKNSGGNPLPRFLLDRKRGRLNHIGPKALAVFETCVSNRLDLWSVIESLRKLDESEAALAVWLHFEKSCDCGLPDWLDFAHSLREDGLLREAVTAFAECWRRVEAGSANPSGNAGVLAAAYEYAGLPQQAAEWTRIFETERDLLTEEVLGDKPLVISVGPSVNFIGDIAARFDLLYKGLKLGLIRLPGNSYVIEDTGKFVNAAYIDLWRDKLAFALQEDAYVKQSEWAQQRNLLDIQMQDGQCLHFPIAYSIINEAWEKSGLAPAIALPKARVEEGWRVLNRVGMREGDWFVALHVRENGFHNDSVRGSSAFSSHRSATLENYQQAIDYIISLGGWVVRIGDPSMSPMMPRQGLFDYARSEIRSADMDIFLMSQCRYLLGTNSGPMAVCTSFGVLCGITNYLPMAFPTCSPRNMMLPRMMWFEKEERYLTISEMLSPPVAFADRFHLFKRAHEVLGIRLVENRAEELLTFTQELHARSLGKTNDADPRHATMQSLFSGAGAYYISPVSKSWLDEYAPQGCLDSNTDPFGLLNRWLDVHTFNGGSMTNPVGALVEGTDAADRFEAGGQGDRPSREVVVQQIQAIDESGNADDAVDLAEWLYGIGYFREALKAAQIAARLNGEDAKIQAQLAEMAEFMGELKLAQDALKKQYELDRSLTTLAKLGQLSLDRGDFAAAYDAFQELRPSDAVTGGHGQGVAARNLGRLEESVALLKATVTVAPLSYSTFGEYFHSASVLGLADDGLACLDRMLGLRPAEKAILFDRVDFLLKFGRKSEALRDLNQIATWLLSGPELHAGYGDRFLAQMRRLDPESGHDPVIVKAKEALASRPVPKLLPANGTVTAPDGSFAHLLKLALLNLTNIDADIRVYRLATAALSGAKIELGSLKALMRDDPASRQGLAEARLQGQWAYNTIPEYVSTATLSMVGMKRLDNIELCVRSVVQDGVPGDLVECGVWRGGASIFMRGLLHALGDADRRVWVCDSFAGLPEIDIEYERNVFGSDLDWVAVDLETVKRNFAAFGLLDDRVGFVKGWFRDSLPDAPIERIAVLRLDGDFYSSTMDVLVPLYDKVSDGGYIIVDDYFSVGTCAKAVHAYLSARNLNPEIIRIDGQSAYWRK